MSRARNLDADEMLRNLRALAARVGRTVNSAAIRPSRLSRLFRSILVVTTAGACQNRCRRPAAVSWRWHPGYRGPSGEGESPFFSTGVCRAIGISADLPLLTLADCRSFASHSYGVGRGRGGV